MKKQNDSFLEHFIKSVIDEADSKGYKLLRFSETNGKLGTTAYDCLVVQEPSGQEYTISFDKSMQPVKGNSFRWESTNYIKKFLNIKNMKFYEFKDSEYYALIGAETEEKAIKFYTETVADLTDEDRDGQPIEITKEEAEAKLLNVCHGEDLAKAPMEFEEYSNSDKPYLVLIDGSLI